ncbi:GNAT family N-acetyltransferase [Taibaiella lutea]|uniref:GNAT family N-acetyltransferase n=1 Tax=Taibaiella lutea TaxID=2608001 RepID=A0A5M6CKT7_9BACT|nr:GNAT family N-acetyltransferase [Taibaiella lutea]KAA5535050.1 GNAT family N-acetyltransferase [Taibaiella lutea]
MTFRTLQGVPFTTILDTFNEAFSDYVVPFKLSLEQLEGKIKSENLNPEISVGAFEDGKLVGYILHGQDIINKQLYAYNGGTGVIPEMRGQKLTMQMYKFIIPVLIAKGFDKIILEVITINKPAIKIYEATGFKISRTLNCYKGTVHTGNTTSDINIKTLERYDREKLQSFWDWQPSWSNSFMAIEQLKESNIALGAYKQDALTGYIIYNPNTKRIQQLAVGKEYRRHRIASQLLNVIAVDYTAEMAMINVDDKDIATNAFLENMGLQKPVVQYEMEMSLR